MEYQIKIASLSFQWREIVETKTASFLKCLKKLTNDILQNFGQ